MYFKKANLLIITKPHVQAVLKGSNILAKQTKYTTKPPTKPKLKVKLSYQNASTTKSAKGNYTDICRKSTITV
jgi:hypothetical protein